MLDRLFWELTYWRTPDEYERLTAGELFTSHLAWNGSGPGRDSMGPSLVPLCARCAPYRLAQ